LQRSRRDAGSGAAPDAAGTASTSAIYDSIVTRLATVEPMFAKAMVDMALDAAGLDRATASPLAYLELIEEQIDPRLRLRHGEDFSVLDLGAGRIRFDPALQVLEVSPILEHLMDLPRGDAAELQRALVACGIVRAPDRIKLMRSREVHLEACDRWVSVMEVDCDADGVVTAVVQDITLARALEGSLREYSRRLRDAQVELIEARELAIGAANARSRFLARMSQELGPPLNAIVNLTQVVGAEGQMFTPAHRETLRDIGRSSGRLLKLVEQVLEVIHIEQGQLDVTAEAIDLGRLIRDCISMATPLFARSQVSLSDETYWSRPVRVQGDPQRVRQILLNFLSNAVKHSPKRGRVAILELTSPHADRVRVGVRDQGPGIPAAEQAKLFEPFKGVREGGSLGIGLAVSREIAELMGGDLGVISVDRAGSTFWVEFPLISN